MKSADPARSQRPAVLVIFSEDSFRGTSRYELDLKFPPQYIPKQYRESLIVDMESPSEATRVESPVILGKGRKQLLGTAAGSFTSAISTSRSVVIPLSTPAERSTPRRQIPHPVKRALLSGYWSPVSWFSTSSGPTCRICFEGSATEDLISPCNCCGSVELVHQSCLEKWLSASDKRNCEVCHHRYDITHERRPFWKWFASRDPNNGPGRCYEDLIGVLILCSLCLMSVYMCGMGAVAYLNRGSWKGYALLTLCVCLLILCVLFLFVTLKFHWVTLKRWQTSNQQVHLVDCKIRRHSHEPDGALSKPQATSPQQPTPQQMSSALQNCVYSPCTSIDVDMSYGDLESSACYSLA